VCQAKRIRHRRNLRQLLQVASNPSVIRDLVTAEVVRAG
jgi:hypothetical protein